VHVIKPKYGILKYRDAMTVAGVTFIGKFLA